MVGHPTALTGEERDDPVSLSLVILCVVSDPLLLSGTALAIWLGAKTTVGLLAASGALALALAGAKLVMDLALRDWVGDAARYFNPKPSNVKVRDNIRTGGVELLRKLHSSGNYNRVIVVGHSLGSAIALDMIYYYWSIASVQHGSPDRPESTAVENLQRTIIGGGRVPASKWKILQRDVAQELRANGTPWLITDLITLGSPLTHLPFLTGLDQSTFADRLAMRELPTCPPIIDGKSLTYPINYKLPNGDTRTFKALHHAACFAATRWTNIYFQHNGWLGGDPVGGPLRALFGDAVDDRDVLTKRWGGRLNHLDYWRCDPRDRGAPKAPLPTLKQALDLDEGFGSRSRKNREKTSDAAEQRADRSHFPPQA